MSKKKKLALVALIAVGVVAVLAIIAVLAIGCFHLVTNGSVSSYYKIFDKKLGFTDVSYDTKYVALPELDGYAIDTYENEKKEKVNLVNEEFAVMKTVTSSGIISHKILSFSAQKVVLTLAEKNTIHTVSLVGNSCAFFVEKRVIDPTVDAMLGLDNTVSVTYMLYDAQGNLVATSKEDEKPYEFADLIIYDCIAYRYDSNGVLSKDQYVPEYLLLDTCFDWNEEYFYVKDTNNGVTVYDRYFNSVAYWCAPGYEKDGCDMFVLDNYNVLLQYKVIVDEDTMCFDYVINNDDYLNLKIDLETYILNVKSGAVKELECFDYIVGGVITRSSMLEGGGKKSYYNFENLVTVTPIVEKQIDDSPSAIDIIKMTNGGLLTKSVKYVDYASADIPVRVSDDRFTVGLLSGETAITNAKGKIFHKFDNKYKMLDQYVICERAIYDLDMNVAYDLYSSDATIMGTIYNTTYINVPTSNGYNVVAFRDGVANTIFTYNADAPTSVFTLLDESRCYSIYNVSTKSYSYYNSEDEFITGGNNSLALNHASEKHMTYLMWTTVGFDASYSLFVTSAN